MSVVVITPPAPLVDLALAKSHLRVEAADDDPLIEAYIAAASANIDGPDTWLGRTVGPQVLEWRLPGFLLNKGERRGICGGQLPGRTIVDIVSINYVDQDGVDQSLAADQYQLLVDGSLGLSFGAAWPATRLQAEAVRVRYRAGYVVDPGADPLDPAIPGAIVAAVLLMVGDLYENRSTTDIGRVAAIPMSTTVERLLNPFRVWSV